MEQSNQKRGRPTGVGIIGMEIYFPKSCVTQADLEVYDKVPKGKYTIGLGQTVMACVNDREDINSISLTCVNNLMKKYNIPYESIGRLEVGTETLLDKSKSVKTVLMNLFKQSGNHDVEGITSINACYGSTNALFNSINWIQSDSWDGRYAILVSADVAVYPKGNARPTGGVGAIAMLLGPNAPIVFDNCRSSFMDHRYDFYKPDPFSEYPTVDGHHSIEIYLGALRESFKTFKQKYQIQSGSKPFINDFDYFCFHTPFSKMVQKSFLAMVMEDIKDHVSQISKGHPASSNIYDDTLIDQLKANNFKLDSKGSKTLLQHKIIGSLWKNKCEKSLYLAKQLGNIYTGSLYNGLISLVCDRSIDLSGKKILLFSYGSGCAASMFMVHVKADYSRQGGIQSTTQFQKRLMSREVWSPELYEQACSKREHLFGQKNWDPQDSVSKFFPGTFYLTKVDEKFCRFYQIKDPDDSDKRNQMHFNWKGGLTPQKTVGGVDLVALRNEVKSNELVTEKIQDIQLIVVDDSQNWISSDDSKNLFDQTKSKIQRRLQQINSHFWKKKE